MKPCKFCGRQSSNRIFCECGKVMSYCWDDKFKIFSLPISFNINIDELRNRYYDIMNKLHPDKFNALSLEEKEIAQEHSALVNSAYSDLKDPWRRAEILLGESDPIPSSKVDTSVLLEVMELNSIEDRIARIKKIKDIENELLDQLEGSFSLGKLDEARNITIRYKFIKRSAAT